MNKKQKAVELSAQKFRGFFVAKGYSIAVYARAVPSNAPSPT